MPNSDFLTQPALPRPAVEPKHAAAIATTHFGLDGRITELGSQQDRNFLIDTGAGRYVLKLANPVFSADELRAQNAALAALAGSGVRIPEVVRSLQGHELVSVDVSGVALLARVLRYLDGEPLTGVERPSREQLRTLGTLSGRVAGGLSELRHPGLDRTTQWDARISGEVVDLLLEHVAQPAKRRVVREATDAALARLEPLRERLRVQAVHGDVTDDNIVLGEDGPGVIDFGDVSDGWLVAELAATVASALHHLPDEPLAVLEVVEAFHAETPLDAADISALWPLVVLRGAVLVVSGEQQVALEADNAYADENRAHEWVAFDVARRLDADELETAIRARLRGPGSEGRASARPAFGRLVSIASTPSHLTDLSVLARELDGGAWLHPDAEDEVLARTSREQGHALTRHGEARLTRARIDRDRASASVALGVTLDAPSGVEVTAPFAGDLSWTGAAWLLAGEGIDLWLDGLDRPHTSAAAPATTTVARGERIGTATRLTAQLSTLPGHRPPAFVTPTLPFAVWAAISPDPSDLFGVDLAAATADPEASLARRDATFATVQEHYFAHPPLIERGWRQHLVDTRAQTYVDMVNNVTQIGHGHPRLVEAVRDQWARLNTNSRFHYDELSRFTERLVEVAPDGLDTVFLVNSGSEAVDLALRLAQVHTGRQTILAVTEAYHGWTTAADAVSSSLGDNPRALETRPDWVKLVAAPNSLRGAHRGPDSAAAYLADLDADLAALDASGTDVAGYIAEPVFGNAGGLMLPDGYLAGVYERIRARGGVCIADEVQVGYGRLGHYFWGSEQQGVVPDVITIAKAMGNGHPLGAVITRREIAESFAAEGNFFSSAGGSPVSAVVGLTVLDVMRDEGLQQNAAVVGDHLAARLRELGERHPLVGAVHGMGLYLGMELVLDRETLEPATAKTALVCDRMLAEGCIVLPTGDYRNVLKIKPPLGITRESADRFVDALDLVLATL
ncbi:MULTISPECIES: aminotransferase [unclassified Leifsonia]|uniref:aminotransferase n=1 Tax=unclassified Leifsonia TaxID=2663824 RepID=UPI0008A8094A|nr:MULTISPECIES: aminotransferase [unclassified Leifsonia]SEI04761.1 4-aminobutyrate aminotransferase [Leifsonia sp. CL154]SFL75093.1 4-aminobutyrate aminotransferase [Leifsonia sp. CL147]